MPAWRPSPRRGSAARRIVDRMLVGLIGRNIMSSLAPALHEDAFAAAGTVGHYHLMDVDVLAERTLEQLLSAARLAGFAGVNVTFPFKEAVIPLLDLAVARGRRDRRGQHRRVRQEGQEHWPQHRPIGLSRRLPRGAGRGGRARQAGPAARRRRRRPGRGLRAPRRRGRRHPDPRPGHRARPGAVRCRRKLRHRFRRSRRGGRHRQRHAGRHERLSRHADRSRRRAARTVRRRRHLHAARDRLSEGRPGARRRGMGGAGMCVHQAAEAFRLFSGLEPDRARMLAKAFEEAARRRGI